jgi:predicted membrane GTPase involved in stress response
MDKAVLEYPQVQAGIILMMDRTLDFAHNEIIVKKAIKYKAKGIIGVDLAGPNRKNFSMQKHAELFALARKAGLGITVHTGEEAQLAEMRYVDEVEKLMVETLGFEKSEILYISAKTGEGVEDLLAAVIERVPSPKGSQNLPTQAYIFDSVYDEHRGIVIFVRMESARNSGAIPPTDRKRLPRKKRRRRSPATPSSVPISR